MSNIQANSTPVHVTNASEVGTAGGATEAKQDTQITAEQAIQTSTATTATKTTAMDTTLGSAADAAVEGDSAGSVDAQLRGINKNAGTTADAAVDTDTTGTISGKLRGLVKLLVSIIATAGSAILTKGIQLLGSDGTNARVIRTTTAGYLQAVRQDPDAAETITAVDGSNPTEGQMVTIDVNTQDVVVKGKLTAADGNTAIDATVFVRERDTNEITSYAAFEDMEVAGNGSFTCSIKPTPAGAAIDRCGIRTDSVGAGTPTFTFALRQCK